MKKVKISQIYNNGNRYEGDWKNGHREGKGILYYNDGDREMGNYLNGKRVGFFIFFSSGGAFGSFFALLFGRGILFPIFI